jgi:hypothetical protein
LSVETVRVSSPSLTPTHSAALSALTASDSLPLLRLASESDVASDVEVKRLLMVLPMAFAASEVTPTSADAVTSVEISETAISYHVFNQTQKVRSISAVA